ncbi:arsenic metallochaperone ArsD family protein [Pediococcus acidilactici]
MVDGQVVKTGTYPSYEEFEKYTGMKIGRAGARKTDAENKAFN